MDLEGITQAIDPNAVYAKVVRRNSLPELPPRLYDWPLSKELLQSAAEGHAPHSDTVSPTTAHNLVHSTSPSLLSASPNTAVGADAAIAPEIALAPRPTSPAPGTELGPSMSARLAAVSARRAAAASPKAVAPVPAPASIVSHVARSATVHVITPGPARQLPALAKGIVPTVRYMPLTGSLEDLPEVSGDARTSSPHSSHSNSPGPGPGPAPNPGSIWKVRPAAAAAAAARASNTPRSDGGMDSDNAHRLFTADSGLSLRSGTLLHTVPSSRQQITSPSSSIGSSPATSPPGTKPGTVVPSGLPRDVVSPVSPLPAAVAQLQTTLPRPNSPRRSRSLAAVEKRAASPLEYVSFSAEVLRARGLYLPPHRPPRAGSIRRPMAPGSIRSPASQRALSSATFTGGARRYYIKSTDC